MTERKSCGEALPMPLSFTVWLLSACGTLYLHKCFKLSCEFFVAGALFKIKFYIGF